MELKHTSEMHIETLSILLIVLNGIETLDIESYHFRRLLLIVLNGIETGEFPEWTWSRADF